MKEEKEQREKYKRCMEDKKWDGIGCGKDGWLVEDSLTEIAERVILIPRNTTLISSRNSQYDNEIDGPIKSHSFATTFEAHRMVEHLLNPYVRSNTPIKDPYKKSPVWNQGEEAKVREVEYKRKRLEEASNRMEEDPKFVFETDMEICFSSLPSPWKLLFPFRSPMPAPLVPESYTAMSIVEAEEICGIRRSKRISAKEKARMD